MALLRDYHAAIGEIIVKYSGTLERFAGDGVMVTIGRRQHVADYLTIIRLVLDHQNALAHALSIWRSTMTGSVKVNMEP